jgi:chromate transporter
VTVSASATRLPELARLFTRLGIVGFGGPTVHIAMIEDEAVARRGWLPREQYVDALAATNLIPGPNSTEMAIHVGYKRAGVAGGIVAGLCFILPAFLLMIGLSWAYFRWNDVASITDIFDGIKPAVIAILAVTLWRLARSSVRDIPQLGLMVAAGAAVFFLAAWEPLILLAAGAMGIILYVRPDSYPQIRLPAFAPSPLWLAPALAASFFAWRPGEFVDLGLVFLRAGGLLFGGGYVLIPLIQDSVTNQHGWLTQKQFIDGVALGQSTPGPIVITATFVGYAAAGLTGALIATACVFTPAFVFAIAGGSFLERIRSWTPASAFLKGVGPAVVGTIAAVAIDLGDEAIINGWTAAVFAVGLVLAWRFGPIPALALAGVTGIAIGQLT